MIYVDECFETEVYTSGMINDLGQCDDVTRGYQSTSRDIMFN